MEIERQNLEWSSRKEDRVQVHKGILLKDGQQDSFLVSVADLLNLLNSGEIAPEFPENYFNLDARGIKVLELADQLSFVTFKKKGEEGTTTLVYPSESPIEYIFSNTPTLVLGKNPLFQKAFKMFNLDSSEIVDYMHGHIDLEDDKWCVWDIFDSGGRGLNKYREELRLTNCPVA